MAIVHSKACGDHCAVCAVWLHYAVHTVIVQHALFVCWNAQNRCALHGVCL